MTIATFKTPGLRDLGHSAPYLHTGRANDLAAVVALYAKSSGLARAETMRNADPLMKRIALKAADTAALVAFLNSLNEDYH
jgi:cytochrome c peroxidase